jgi:hypothetical protein
MVAIVAAPNTLVTIITLVQPLVAAGYISVGIKTSHGPKTKTQTAPRVQYSPGCGYYERGRAPDRDYVCACGVNHYRENAYARAAGSGKPGEVPIRNIQAQIRSVTTPRWTRETIPQLLAS